MTERFNTSPGLKDHRDGCRRVRTTKCPQFGIARVVRDALAVQRRYLLTLNFGTVLALYRCNHLRHPYLLTYYGPHQTSRFHSCVSSRI
jgi:hypothetical protein